MKKLLSIILFLAAVVTFTACGEKPQLSLSVTDEATGGKVNNFTGLSVVAQEGWHFSSDESIAQMYEDGITAEEMKALTPRQLAERETIYDYYIADNDGKNMAVVYIYNTAIKYGESKNPARDFITEFTGRSEGVSGRHIGTAEIGGKEYTTATYLVDGRRQYFALRDVGGGYVCVIVCISTENASGQYFWDLFEEGHVKKAADIENVPDFRVYDDKNYSYENKSTGIKVHIPRGWYGETLDGIGEEIYKVKEGVYPSVTKEVLAEQNAVYDIILNDKNSKDSIKVSYESTIVYPSYYKLSPEEILTTEVDRSSKYIENVIDLGEVEINGNTFIGKKLETNLEMDLYILVRKLNDDFVVLIQISTYNLYDLSYYISVFNENKSMPVENIIPMSSFDETTKQFHNEKTGLTLTIPQGWEKAPLENMEALCWSDAAEIDMSKFTDEDYTKYTYIPDCYMWTDDEDMFLVNINRYFLTEGVKPGPDLSEFYEAEMERNRRKGAIVTQEETLEIGGLTFYIFSLENSDRNGNIKNYIGTAEFNEDYFIQFNYRGRPGKSSMDKVLEIFGI